MSEERRERFNPEESSSFKFEDLKRLKDEAELSPRQRALQPLHEGPWEHAHVYPNRIMKESYIRPHRHDDRYKTEHYLLLEGQGATVFFSDNGEIEEVVFMEGVIDAVVNRRYPENLFVKVKAGRWHTFVALEDCTLYAVKGQPDEGYIEDTDKVSAPWTPKEGTKESQEYLSELRQKVVLSLPNNIEKSE